MRKYYWYLTAYLKKHGLVLISSIIGAIVLFSILVPTLVQTLEIKDRKYIGIIGKYNLDNLPLEISSYISSGLTKIDEEGNITPNIAERINIEDEGQSYRFIIKKDLKWQDGHDLKPEDINYQLQDTEIISTKNDILFKLPAPFAPFPSVVSKPLFKKTTQSHRVFLTRENLIGIGDYIISDYKLKNNHLTEITLDSLTERRVYRFYFSEDEMVLAFKRGEIDIIEDLSNPHSMESWKNITLEKVMRTDRYLGLFLDNNNPLFPKNMRQALSYSITKPTDKTRALGPINPDSWAYLEGGKSYKYDLDRAIERIIDDLPVKTVEFTLTTTSEFQSEAEKIKTEWENLFNKAKEECNGNKDIEEKSLCDNLNAKINIKVTNFPDLNNYEAILIGQEIPSDPDQYSLWHSDQSTNFTHYKNTRIDALLERGRTTVDQTERKEIYQEFQQFFLEDAPAIFIRHLDSYKISR
ncbi:MAG: ABC transporter substrate-binding protein [Candidatus Pacebacteria bacterium]|nr:ABC transporter substrate-binding protein [Candidatus Paceibacterota bacterium]